MNVVGALRVKNEARWIERSLTSIGPACDSLVVFNDHSSDATRVLALREGALVLDSPFEDTGQPQEVRDKNYLLGICIEAKADWVIMIDGDEALMPGHAEKLRTLLLSMERYPGAARALAFDVLYLWDREDQVRIDGVYRAMSRVSAFRPGAERFEPTGPRGFHCGNAPQGIGRRAHGEVSLLHYGYIDREDRLRKYEWYRAQDPGNVAEDDYRHIVIGDVFPADSKFRHGGPLKLRQLG